MSGLLAAGAVSATMEVAHAENFAGTCEGNSDNSYICNIDTTVSSASSMTVTVDSGAANENVNVQWTVACTGGNQEGATDDASTPLSVPLAPLPAAATDGTCSVNVGISLPANDITPKIDYTGELDYAPAGSTSTATVNPVKGFGGKCMDDKRNSSANGNAIVIWGCSSSDQAENWSFSNSELIHNGKCLNDKGDGGSGSKLVLYTCNGGSNEKWSQLSNGELKLSAHNGTLCANDPRNSTTNGTQLIVYKCTDSANEKWSLP